MAEGKYVEKAGLLEQIRERRPLNWSNTDAELAEQSAWDSFEAMVASAPEVRPPRDYSCTAEFDGEKYMLRLSVPISKAVCDALAAGKDLWDVLLAAETARQKDVTAEAQNPGVPFTVLDPRTGEYPDLWKIALEEDWAKGLMYCDMDGFAIMEDGLLVLMDECGNHAYCPEGRFEVTIGLKEM